MESAELENAPHSGVHVIAEVGANHGGDVDIAHRMIDELADQGCQLIKFQVYTAEELVADVKRDVQWGAPGCQVTESVGVMFERVALPWSSFDELFQHARQRGMDPFGTPFSQAGLELLMSLNPSRIKIASSDVTYSRLLTSAAATGLPVIMSLGKSTMAEVDRAVLTLEAAGCIDLNLLHCVAAYPTPIDQANLLNITTLRTMYPEHRIGFSDHTQGMVASIVAVALGASIIERHVTLSQEFGGPDDWFSLPIHDYFDYVDALRNAQASLGSTRKRILPSEAQGRRMGTRSLFAACALTAGTLLLPEHVVALRPSTGLDPGLEGDVVGFKITRDIDKGEPLAWDMFKP